ncbi:DUF3375 domain-containing protein [Nocardia sp. CA-151230]|uniref:DUF3375 domain-containing protein n=1 Tax=Nocardia sp. CA-151230 TaxID=3239982 RepID=UPI003D8A2840
MRPGRHPTRAGPLTLPSPGPRQTRVAAITRRLLSEPTPTMLHVSPPSKAPSCSSLRKQHPAWRLLRADNAPLVLSFLGAVFVEENARSMASAELADRLDDVLYALNERLGAGTFPKTVAAYLNDWAAPEAGWLRKFYPPGADEAHFDATPAVEKALAWVKGLAERSFVGTESRLNTVFELLRQMAFGAETDPEVRLAELRRRREEIDAEIESVAAGRFSPLDQVALRDRYQQFTTTARELLADFREVEANFRVLDRELRERIATWDGSKAGLLDDMLGTRDAIAESDQGRIFQAFYDFRLSYQKQLEFTELLAKVQELAAIGEPDPRMRRIHHDWLDAGGRTQATVRLLSEQLRRFLDDQVWLENRRVMDILRNIESNALRVRQIREPRVSVELDATAADPGLPMERPLYRVADKAALVGAVLAGTRGPGPAPGSAHRRRLPCILNPLVSTPTARRAARKEHPWIQAEATRP